MSLAGGSSPLEQGTGEGNNWDKFKIWAEKHKEKKIHWGLYDIKMTTLAQKTVQD